jgi:hypothetical protein
MSPAHLVKHESGEYTTTHIQGFIMPSSCSHKPKATFTTSLCMLALALGLTACGSGGGDSPDNGNNGGGSGGETSIVADGITLPLHGSPNGHDFWPRNSGSGSIIEGIDTTSNTTFFSGKFRLQRLLASQATTVVPPQKLTFQVVDASSGIVYFTETVSRGTFEPSLDLWSNGASGTWPYSVYASMGYRMPAGTTVKWYLVDNGDGIANSGDEFNGAQMWQGTPFLPPTWTETQALAPKTSPIPALEIVISAAG